MYYQSYEDYIRSILGYPVQNNMNNSFAYDIEHINTYNNSNVEYLTSTPRYSNEVLELYPEIYKIVNPMVCKICEANTKPITNELIEQMTDEIYLNLESDTNEEVVNISVNLPSPQSELNGNRQTQKITQNIGNNTSKKIRDNRQDSASSNREDGNKKIVSQNRENRQIRRRNNTLRDLIKILILNQLLGGGRPQRPPRPYPPRPPYPPYPGGPRPNPRPPIMPRDAYFED